MSEQPRKIELPDYCCPFDYSVHGGDKGCDHDFPPADKVEYDDFVQWTCGKCGCRYRVGVYQ